jgi:translation initiation factor IF-2
LGKIRVYQLARKYDISSEALIKILVKEGTTVKSHMSTVDENVEILIEQHINRIKAATKREVKQKAKKPKLVKKPAKGRRKKTIKEKETDQKAVKESVKRTLARLDITRKSKRRKRKEDTVEVEEEKSVIRIPEFSTVADLAQHLGLEPTEIIQKCLNLGMMVTINQRLDSDSLVMIADEYGYLVEFAETFGQELLTEKKKAKPERMAMRPPVVTIMGHVDHGKTSLLDVIRKSNIIAGEKGGITQHIGAYEVEVKNHMITFIDTPGHKAFTAMRSRGAQVTDIVILLVAADDGVMPQTSEAINHARAADVPMIIAVNKIDLPNADLEKVKRDLLKENVVLEEYGGNVMAARISAKSGEGVDRLLEMILLQAEMMELKADPEAQVRGVVLEARKEEGRGIVCTVLIQQGTLKVGDFFLTGNYSGRVRALLNERGKRIDSAPPATPVVVLGAGGVPQAGDAFIQVDDERTAKEIASKRQQFNRERERRVTQRITLEDLYMQIQQGAIKELNIILRGDTDGSVEALADSLSSIEAEEVKIDIIHKGVGLINESDILLASASNAVVIGFHTDAAPQAEQIAKSENVDVRFYDVIYKAIEDIKAAMSGLLEPEIIEKDIGEVEIRQVFRVSKIGAVAGCYVLSGQVTRNAFVRISRDGEIVHKGVINSLKRFKDDVKEVRAGFECGIGIADFEDVREGDKLQVYIEEKKHKTID